MCINLERCGSNLSSIKNIDQREYSSNATTTVQKLLEANNYEVVERKGSNVWFKNTELDPKKKTSLNNGQAGVHSGSTGVQRDTTFKLGCVSPNYIDHLILSFHFLHHALYTFDSQTHSEH
jgi:predicted RNA binding protein YcfA (HicA-like mRNA interferase family)